jgi:hypothetical protein
VRRVLPVLAAALTIVCGAGGTAHAAPTPPPEFGTDWDDPRTPEPPIARPGGPACTVKIVDHKFVNFDPYTGTYTPTCRGPWSTVVLRLEGAVAGRQFDRLGYLTIGGVPVFKTSTPEPSVDGIRWTVEKDVTGYSALLTSTQPIWMLIGNVVNETYTGVLDVQVYLEFYRGRAAATATDVLPGGSVTIPRNTERLVAEVYATGSGGGCEEFWYLTTPPNAGYSCPATDIGPYREVQVLVDGVVAGVAAPYPHIYTGGWSNPFLWYVLPAPRAFDVAPVTYDLTPFVGRLTDGQAHSITTRVVGVPTGQAGWEAPTAVLAWQDHGSRQVAGELLSTSLSADDASATVAPGAVTSTGTRRFTAVGYLRTSHGRVLTAVDRSISSRSTHTWGAEENPDALKATWIDESSVVSTGRKISVTRLSREYLVDGAISIAAGDRLTTRITVSDKATGISDWSPVRIDDTYRGEASWTLNVARPDRHAMGTSTRQYRSGSYCRLLSTRNGTVVTDSRRC